MKSVKIKMRKYILLLSISFCYARRNLLGQCNEIVYKNYGPCDKETGLMTKISSINCSLPMLYTQECGVDCSYSQYGPFGDCIDNTKTRTRTIIHQGRNGGIFCEETKLFDSEACIECNYQRDWYKIGECVNGMQNEVRDVDANTKALMWGNMIKVPCVTQRSVSCTTTIESNIISTIKENYDQATILGTDLYGRVGNTFYSIGDKLTKNIKNIFN